MERRCLKRAWRLRAQLIISVQVDSSLNDLGMLRCFDGDPEEGRTLLEESLRWRASSGIWKLIAMPLNNLALAVLDCGDDEQAHRAYRRVASTPPEAARREGVAWGLAAAAEVMTARREMAQATVLWAAAYALNADLGIPFMSQMQLRQERSTIMRGHL